ncbi:helix-turn-helix domain-containing protein [Ktedonospora formicarum]|uniref:helix-turn-helix domain-containing protein n=1 Tax=Ktedonospora formicarum TaxID=2778364 RepID=UPI003B75C603
MRAHSQELRQHVLQAVDEGMSHTEIIERFYVSRATIKRYTQQPCYLLRNWITCLLREALRASYSEGGS